MKVGIVATEFPPAIGGMEQHAFGLAEAFAVDSDVTVFTKEQYSNVQYCGRYSVKPILTERIISDARKLRHERIDRWLTLNATYSFLSRYVEAPVFAYCHGNDFLKPWTDVLTGPERSIVDTMGRLPYCWRFKAPIEQRLERHRIASGLARSKMVFVNSGRTGKLLAAAFPKIHTPAVSWPGVAEDFFCAPAKIAARGGGPLRLLTVARLCHTKNIGGVLHALASLKGELDFVYTVAGDGVLRRELECLAADLGVRHQTRFLGSLGSDDIIAALDASDLFVLPSLGESFGIAYAEAAARGVPSLANRIGCALDAVLEGLNGIVVEGPEPEQIAEGLRRFSRMQSRPDREEIRRFALRFRRSVVADQMKKAVLGPT